MLLDIKFQQGSMRSNSIILSTLKADKVRGLVVNLPVEAGRDNMVEVASKTLFRTFKMSSVVVGS